MSGTEQPQADTSLAHFVSYLRDTFDLALEANQLDGVWITAGSEQMHFRDDHGPAFKANAYFTQWVQPEYSVPGAALYIGKGNEPKLFTLAQEDYWHATPTLPDYLAPHVEIRTFPDSESLTKAMAAAAPADSRLAIIGEPNPDNVINAPLNPAPLLDYLDFYRATKHGYELEAMRKASDIGVRGHIAARDAFFSGATEFDIHMAYLAASQQTENDLPYGNIIALNQHAAILHYQHQTRSHESPAMSFLIDAGGNYQGYASDITRTYAASGDTHAEFRDLIALVQKHQDHIIELIEPGMRYADLHVAMHTNLASVLEQAGIVTVSADQAFEQGLTEKFCPHGLGHLLGLQVHDVGGHLGDAQGNPAPPPENYPSLRFTRAMEVGQVFTIEPGLYFIPSLLKKLENDKSVDWNVVERLTPYGGIRIEDNVRVLPDGVENLTRDAWQRLEA